MAVNPSRRFLSILVGFILIISGWYVFYNPLFIPVLVQVLGIFMLVSGIFLLIEALRLPYSSLIRNSLIVDSLLLIIIGLGFAFLSSSVTVTVLGYILLIWFIFTSILQIWLASKFNVGWSKWLIIILSLLVIVFSLYGITNLEFVWGILYFTIAFQFIFLGVIRIVYAFTLE